ncbi:MAG: HAMP domain-containing sensor histidine kinase [Candidatus Aminicenantes bacterium]|nr:HAMP domain-containing sensor histidine kinase [Candidatus Aminicenantes bacterium]
MKIWRFNHVSAKTKILLFAFLFIILPSGILGYLGFRSIGNRGLSLKENYRRMARLMRDELEGEISGLEGRFVREILEQDWNGDTPAIRLLLSRIRERHPSIGETFIVSADGSVIHPQFYLGTENPRRQGRMAAMRNSFIERGEHYEFTELDCPMAARSYEEAVRRVTSPEHRLYARLLLGRCYFKMKNYLKAGEQFHILSEQSQEARSSDGTPLKIIGLFRLAETYASLRDGGNEVKTLLALFEELSLGPGGFESREFYLESVRADLDRIIQGRFLGKNEQDRWDRLKLEDKARRERIRRLDWARQALLSQLDFYDSPNGKNSRSPARDSEPSSHMTTRDEDGTPHRLGYLFLPSKAALSGTRVLAYEIDKTYVLTELFPRLMDRGAAGESVRAGLLNEEGPLTSLSDAPPPGQALAAENLSEYFPWWRLALFDTRGKSIEQLVRREMRLYGAVLLGIAVLILSGIVMTLRAATHEVETVRLRSDFVSNVSHELKTPLSLIRLFGETMESDQWTDDGKRREFSRIIARESSRLTYLIDNILDFSKIDSGRKEYAFERGNLVKVISDTLEAYRFYLRDQGFEFDISLPPGPIFLSMDKDAIAQAVLNLLNNAEKYSGEQKYIGVKMTFHGDQVLIIVEDRGPGIPPSDLKHIFEKFYRGGPGPAREAQGCGLGLTIVKSTVEGHGGHISVESELGRGSRFIITLSLGGKDDTLHGSAEGENGENPDR